MLDYKWSNDLYSKINNNQSKSSTIQQGGSVMETPAQPNQSEQTKTVGNEDSEPNESEKELSSNEENEHSLFEIAKALDRNRTSLC